MRSYIDIIENALADEDGHPQADIYRSGYCHALALALHRLTGDPMVALEAREGRRWAIIHVMVETGDDTFLDIDGERSIDDILFDANLDPDETQVRLTPITEVDFNTFSRRGMVALSPEVMRGAEEAARWVLSRQGLTEDWDHYTEIGHKKGTSEVWYMLPGGKLEVFPYNGKRDNHDMEEGGLESKAIAVGRIDHKAKKISIRTPLSPGNSWLYLPEAKIEFIVKHLARKYPDYQIWYFGHGATEIRQVA